MSQDEWMKKVLKDFDTALGCDEETNLWTIPVDKKILKENVMTINPGFKERLRSFNPIKEVVQEVIPLKGNVGKCPKHDDKNPSFSVHPEKGICQCFAGCTNGSLDVFGFCQWYYDDTFPQVLERLAKRAGITIETSERKNYKKDPYKEIKDFLIRDDILYRRWERHISKEIGLMHATWSQKLRKRAYKQYEEGVVTKYALQRRLLALERTDEEFESIK